MHASQPHSYIHAYALTYRRTGIQHTGMHVHAYNACMRTGTRVCHDVNVQDGHLCAYVNGVQCTMSKMLPVWQSSIAPALPIDLTMHARRLSGLMSPTGRALLPYGKDDVIVEMMQMCLSPAQSPLRVFTGDTEVC
jgi:hypothetical protein